MKVILENRLIHGIPLIECYTVDLSLDEDKLYEKPLLFFNHGFNSKKEDNYWLMIELANHGFYVVALDAYLHGERVSEPFISGENKDRELLLFDIIRRTGKDLNYLFKHHYNKYFREYSVMGISMGGFVSFYAATLSTHIKGIIPIIGSPSFVEFSKFLKEVHSFSDDEYAIVVENLEEDDPMNHIEHFDFVKILMLNGEKDDVVPDQWTKEFIKNIMDKNINKEAKLISYDAGHEVTDKMVKDLLAWCVDNLL